MCDGCRGRQRRRPGHHKSSGAGPLSRGGAGPLPPLSARRAAVPVLAVLDIRAVSNGGEPPSLSRTTTVPVVRNEGSLKALKRGTARQSRLPSRHVSNEVDVPSCPDNRPGKARQPLSFVNALNGRGAIWPLSLLRLTCDAWHPLSARTLAGANAAIAIPEKFLSPDPLFPLSTGLRRDTRRAATVRPVAALSQRSPSECRCAQGEWQHRQPTIPEPAGLFPSSRKSARPFREMAETHNLLCMTRPSRGSA
jgi:hypothetical protein